MTKRELTPQEKAFQTKELDRVLKNDPDLAGARQLNQLLKKQWFDPVYITVKEFEQFLPIFQELKEITDPEEKRQYDQMIKRLTEEWHYRVGLYRAVTIIDPAQPNAPLLVVPPVFLPFADVPDDETTRMAEAYFKKNLSSDIPKHKAAGLACLYENIRRSFATPEYRERLKKNRELTHQQLREFDELKQQSLTGVSRPTQVSKEKTLSSAESYKPADDDWSFS